MSEKSASRKSNIIEKELEKELLIYDLTANKAFCLNETSALVYQLADGTKTSAEISDLMSKKLKTRVSEDLVWLALDGLGKDNLLEKTNELADHFAGLTRREAIKKVGLASMVTLPVISSIIAPNAVMALSTCARDTQVCTFSNNTRGNCCNSNQRCFTTTNAAPTCRNCYAAPEPLASCQSRTGGGCCNLRSDRNLCCSGRYNESTTNNLDYVCSCA